MPAHDSGNGPTARANPQDLDEPYVSLRKARKILGTGGWYTILKSATTGKVRTVQVPITRYCRVDLIALRKERAQRARGGKRPPGPVPKPAVV